LARSRASWPRLRPQRGPPSGLPPSRPPATGRATARRACRLPCALLPVFGDHATATLLLSNTHDNCRSQADQSMRTRSHRSRSEAVARPAHGPELRGDAAARSTRPLPGRWDILPLVSGPRGRTWPLPHRSGVGGGQSVSELHSAVNGRVRELQDRGAGAAPRPRKSRPDPCLRSGSRRVGTALFHPCAVTTDRQGNDGHHLPQARNRNAAGRSRCEARRRC